MSDYERWIIYPLLLLSLSFAARDQIGFLKPTKINFSRSEVTFDKVVCNELSTLHAKIVSRDEKPRVDIASSVNGAGMIVLYGSEDKPAVVQSFDIQRRVGYVETYDHDGSPLVRLSATDRGGLVLAMTDKGAPHVLIGHNSKLKVSGLFAVDNQGHLFTVQGTNVVSPWGVHMPWPEEEDEP